MPVDARTDSCRLPPRGGVGGDALQPGQRLAAVDRSHAWRRRFALATAFAAVFLTLAVAMAAVAVNRNNAASAQGDQRAAISSAAGQLSEALMTYDYRHLDAFKAKVLSLATGSLRNQFEDAFGGLSATITKYQAQAQATVQGIFLDGGSAAS